MHNDSLTPVLLGLIVILAAAKIGGEIFERLRQPSVLGELIFGVILGNIILLNPNWTFFEPLRSIHIEEGWAITIDNFARLGVILLLFEVGLESTVAEMAKVGVSSLLVGVAGTIAPFILGYLVSWLFISEVPSAIAQAFPTNFSLTNIHIFVGAVLCATSVGITARVFKDLGKLHIKEAKIILGAAVIDDVLGLIILAVVSGIVAAALSGEDIGILHFTKIAIVAMVFLVASIMLGQKIIPRTLGVLSKLKGSGIMLISALLFCFILSWAANAVGLATIVGAFAAGLILEEVHFKGFREEVSLLQLIKPISTIFVPIFFIMMGIQVRLEAFANVNVLWLALGLTLAAIIGKQICSLAALGKGLDRLTIGLGMIPRGEVGLIFASIGRNIGVLDDALFSAIVIMVIVTTFVTPPVLKFALSRWDRKLQK